ncbi:MAG TPA: electron transfer flavoprotein subunit beta/FixA family protein [Gemmatimonadales bacterium]|nr:electron transfer flavoprotein subunit beta/FixA family protein [Gemmatimonadales bacterium]
MKIAVCIKRVPDSEIRVAVAADGKSLDEAAVKFGLNPYDEFAVEEALRRREHAGAGEVVALSVGPAAVQETLRSVLAMGADRALLLQVAALPADAWIVARALADALAGEHCDLILFGKLAIDDYNQQVGPMVAELLGVPCVTAVSALDLEGEQAVAQREIEGGIEVCRFPLPAVLTVDKGLNEPRYPTLKGIMAAKRKPLEVRPVELPAGGIEVLGLRLPSPRRPGRIVEGPGAVAELVRLLREEAKVL